VTAPGRRAIVRPVAALLVVAGLVAATGGVAQAHPLGNLSVNTYDGIVVGATGTRVDHVEDLAEIPALAVVHQADADGDGRLDGAEAGTWAGQRCAAAAGRVRLARDGVTVALRVASAVATQASGQSGLPLLRVECLFDGGRPLVTGRTRVDAEIEPVSDIGWREITLAGDGATVLGSDVPARSVSGRLTSYPVALRGNQPHVTSAHASVAAGGAGLAAPGAGSAASPVGGVPAAGGLTARLQAAVDRTLNREVTGGNGGLPAGLLLVGLLVAAMLLGAVHALAPGHGKTVMAAAMIAGSGASRRSRVREAVSVGATVTLAHTTSVLVIAGALTVLGAALPAHLLGALEAISGLLVVAVGVGLLRAALRRGHVHAHDHDHGHGHGHRHGHGHGPSRLPRRGLLGLGLAGGLTPSPSALLVLLGASASGHPLAGVAAVVAFGAGMATTLTGVGVLVGLTGDRLLRRPARGALARRILGAAPRFAGLAVVAAGGMLALRGLGQAVG
jgi:ABC-type nickel/cobalt efflux system permease component RcnA